MFALVSCPPIAVLVDIVAVVIIVAIIVYGAIAVAVALALTVDFELTSTATGVLLLFSSSLPPGGGPLANRLDDCLLPLSPSPPPPMAK